MKFPARLAFSVAIVIQLAACSHVPSTKASSAPASSASEFIGCWHGEDYQPVLRQSATWLMDRKQDGTFKIEFWSWSTSGSLGKQTELGRWTTKGNTYTTVTTEIDGEVIKDPYVDDYEVRSFDGTEMVYFHSRSGLIFKSKKVSCQFVPPSPRKLESLA